MNVVATQLFLVVYLFSIDSLFLLGIGKPPGHMDPKAFLLQKFNAKAREQVVPFPLFSSTFLHNTATFQV